MSKVMVDRELLEQALDLISSTRWGTTPYMDMQVYIDAAKLRAALRAALAQQEQSQQALGLSSEFNW